MPRWATAGHCCMLPCGSDWPGRVMEQQGRRGRKRSTIADVARLAGVSPMTVSRVVNDGKNVRSDTRERVLAVIATLNYAPNAAARALAAADDIRIGLIYNNPSASYLSALLVGALSQASRIGAQIVVEQCEEGVQHEREAIAHLMRAGIDGLLLPAPIGDAPEIERVLRDADLPVVSVASGRTLPGGRCVRIDDFEASRAMTLHLIETGHRSIGFVIGNPNQIASSERERGFRAALAEAGIEPAPHWVQQGYFDYRSGLVAGTAILAEDRPTAIFASNDDMAAGVCAAAHRQGLDVPRDLSVTGFDDTQMAIAIWPELTTIRQPIDEMASVAVDMLARAVRDGLPAPAEGLCRTLPFSLVSRASVAAPA